MIISFKNLKIDAYVVHLLEFFSMNTISLWSDFMYILHLRQCMRINTPSLSELRSRRYTKRSRDSVSGITHSRLWETTTIVHAPYCKGKCSEKCFQNRQHTLRISSTFAAALNSMPGPKRRRSSRVTGNTPDESYIQAGQRACGIRHQLRRRMCLLFAMSNKDIQKMLDRYPDYRPKTGKIAVGIVMPSMEQAIDELCSALTEIQPSLREHPALQRRWGPALCRLLEIHWQMQHE
jgi:hypothetical protein